MYNIARGNREGGHGGMLLARCWLALPLAFAAGSPAPSSIPPSVRPLPRELTCTPQARIWIMVANQHTTPGGWWRG